MIRWYKNLGYYQVRAIWGMLAVIIITAILSALSNDWWYFARVGGSQIICFIIGIILSKFDR